MPSMNVHLSKTRKRPHDSLFTISVGGVNIFVGTNMANNIRAIDTSSPVEHVVQVPLGGQWDAVCPMLSPTDRSANVKHVRHFLIKTSQILHQAYIYAKQNNYGMVIMDEDGENAAPAAAIHFISFISGVPIQKTQKLVEQVSEQRGRRVDGDLSSYRILFRPPFGLLFLSALSFFPIDVQALRQANQNPQMRFRFQTVHVGLFENSNTTLPAQILFSRDPNRNRVRHLQGSRYLPSFRGDVKLLFLLNAAMHSSLLTWDRSMMDTMTTQTELFYAKVHVNASRTDIEQLCHVRLQPCESKTVLMHEHMYAAVYYVVLTKTGSFILAHQRSVWHSLDLQGSRIHLRSFDTMGDLEWFLQPLVIKRVFKGMVSNFELSYQETKDLLPHTSIFSLQQLTPSPPHKTPVLVDFETIWSAEALDAEHKETTSPFPLDINNHGELCVRTPLPNQSLIALKGKMMQRPYTSPFSIALPGTTRVLDCDPYFQSAVWINGSGKVHLVGGHGTFLFAFATRSSETKNCQIRVGKSGYFMQTLRRLEHGEVVTI